jgi:GNAT superfamily N-acetyltransferase
MDETERVAAALCRMWRARTVALGGTLHEHDGVLSCLTGLDFAPFNPSLVEGPPRDPVAALAAAEDVYRGAGLPFGIDLEPSLHPEVRSAAEATGLRIVESRPGMTAVPSEFVDAAAPRGVVIGSAREHLDAVADVVTDGFGGEVAINRGFVAPAAFDDPRARIYLAWLDGRPVATVETSLHDGTLGVFGVTTVPDARRIGIGAAITAHAVRDRANDAELAYLQASDDGHGVYARLGFRDTSTWEVWSRA